jgi:hypothetical protein
VCVPVSSTDRLFFSCADNCCCFFSYQFTRCLAPLLGLALQVLDAATVSTSAITLHVDKRLHTQCKNEQCMNSKTSQDDAKFMKI